MTIEFLNAAALKKHFLVYGNFYERKVKKDVSYSGRNILEIIHHERCPLLPKDVSKLKADAIMVMMNPGSSKPLENEDQIQSLKKNDEIKLDLVKTRPDNTQYQVMRIMYYMKWQHVRVINLSDIREAKSPLFLKKAADLSNEHKFDGHSIFAKSRKDELEQALTRQAGAPILTGWGVSDQLDDLINLALEQELSLEPMIGLEKEGLSPIKFFHPLPTLQKDKNLWVENMLKALNF